MKVVVLGTYDIGKPRMRILLRGLKENGVEVTVCHVNVWEGVEDKSQLKGVKDKMAIALRMLLAYPKLVWRYAHLPVHDIVLIGYLGLFDLLVLWPFIKLRRTPIVWDVFISLYNTVVEDRKLISPWNPLAALLYLLEWTCLRIATRSFIDTEAHAQYLRDTYHCRQSKIQRVFVGAEPEAFNSGETSLSTIKATDPLRVVFYGQFIPLHGISTIVQAAKLSKNQNIEWLLIGRGQEAGRIKQQLNKSPLTNLKWIEWVKYDELVSYLKRSHIALGIFGDTDKAARVIPNKVFQILSANRPLITRDSPAMRELIKDEDPYCNLIPAGNPEMLLSAVLSMRETLVLQGFRKRSSPYAQEISPKNIGFQLTEVFEGLIRKS